MDIHTSSYHDTLPLKVSQVWLDSGVDWTGVFVRFDWHLCRFRNGCAENMVSAKRCTLLNFLYSCRISGVIAA